MGRRLSRAEAHERLVGAGLPFALEEIEIRGVTVRAWKNAPPTLGAVLAASAEHGERACLVLDGERLSYADHHRQACQLAQALRTRYGIRKGDRVAIAMRNLPEWSVAFWAITGIGAIVVPLNAWFTARELAYCVTDSGSLVVVADGKRAALLAACEEDLGLRGLIVVRGEEGRSTMTALPFGTTCSPPQTTIHRCPTWRSSPTTTPRSSIPPAPRGRPRARSARTVTSAPTS